MTPEALAALHARCFDAAPPPWSASAFASALAEPAAFLIATDAGFALGRAAAGEAELLTLAVAPPARRRGAGRRLLAGFEDEARRRGAAEAFLEVAAGNGAARGLYRAAGWTERGRRPGYFRAGAEAAIVMGKPLVATPACGSGGGKTD